MTVKFEGNKYQVSFCDMFEVHYQKLILFLKRQKRRLRLLVSREDIGQYFIITGLWIILGSAMLVLGRYLSADGETPYGIADVLWEYFVSVIIVYAVGSVERIRSYRSKIKAQHNIYVTAMSDFEKLIESFVEDDQYHYHPLYCNKCLEDTIDYIAIRYPKRVGMSDSRRLYLMLIRDRLDRVESEFMNNSIVQCRRNDSWLYDSIDEARMLVNKMLMREILSIEEVGKLSRELKHIVDCMREPWRVDVSKKIRILKLLDKESDNEIKEDFYYKMLLYGHKFNSKSSVTIVQVRRKGVG